MTPRIERVHRNSRRLFEQQLFHQKPVPAESSMPARKCPAATNRFSKSAIRPRYGSPSRLPGRNPAQVFSIVAWPDRGRVARQFEEFLDRAGGVPLVEARILRRRADRARAPRDAARGTGFPTAAHAESAARRDSGGRSVHAPARSAATSRRSRRSPSLHAPAQTRTLPPSTTPARGMDAVDARAGAEQGVGTDARADIDAGPAVGALELIAGGGEGLDVPGIAKLGHVGQTDRVAEAAAEGWFESADRRRVERFPSNAMRRPIRRRRTRRPGIRCRRRGTGRCRCRSRRGARAERPMRGDAEGPQAFEGRRAAAGIGGQQDAGPGPGGFPTELSLFEEHDRRAFPGEKVRAGQTDHAAADEDEIGSFGHAVLYT